MSILTCLTASPCYTINKTEEEGGKKEETKETEEIEEEE